MTRPQIIRADTLDLQDRASPTAQDHSRQPQHPAPLGIGPAAPHHEASLRQVDHERHSEQAQLQNATWTDANTLHDDPDSDDERIMVKTNGNIADSQRDEQAVRLNGGTVDDSDDADLQEADAEEDMDDGGISSSPSIDDGGYSFASLATSWPERTSSLPSSPVPSPASFSSPSSTCVDSSSPFTTTPIHFPLSVAAAPRSPRVPAASEKPISTSISFRRTSPTPFLSPSPLPKPPTTSNHHRGEYTWISDGNGDDDNDDNTYADDTATHSANPVCTLDGSPETELMVRTEKPTSESCDDSQISLASDVDADETNAMQQVPRSPTFESPGDPFPEDTEPQPQPSEDDDAWTTDSDADSWDEEAANDDDDSLFSKDARFVDSGWGGECLRETEDIDFDFVYALHTFVATVEGQANALKGDTMVLLDDSNSYWWLVRVVKDSSIGYLPAEHIETPTERLARLNKHRNIDLSATMLGDTAERTKNPLKKAIRRRNAKTVQFGEPTYVEASDYDYSSDEDDDDELFGGSDPTQVQVDVTSERSDPDHDDDLKVEPLKLGGNKGPNASGRFSQDSSDDAAKGSIEKRSSEEIIDRAIDQKVSRNGTLRNTDSFFKDENAETRKISLTPNLLRDDSNTTTTGTRERGASLESLEKNGFADKVKDDKKKKEKKPGMLSGLFKRKDKKSRGGVLDSIDSDMEKPSSEDVGGNSPQAKDSLEERTSTDQTPSSPQRTASKGKLQKPQRGREDSPSKIVTKSILKKDDGEYANGSAVDAGGKQATAPASTMRLISAEQEDMMHTAPEQHDPSQSPQSPEGRARSNSAASKLNPMNMLKSSQTNDEPRPEKVKKAKQRVQLDDFDSDENEPKDPFADSNSATQATEAEPTGRLSESPVQISVADAQPQAKESTPDKDHDLDAHRPPGLAADTSSQDTRSPVSTPSPDQSSSTNAPSQHSLSSQSTTPTPTSALHPPTRPAPGPKTKEKPSSTSASSDSSSLPAWSDTSLRLYLDDGSDIRDTLALIHDTTGVVPVGRDHPLMSSLFVEESKTITQLGGELDNLLTNWLENKRRKHKASAAGAIRAR